MKSQVHALSIVADGIIADIRQAYPVLRGLDRDAIRLASLVEDRGLGLFTLDLPHLDSCLLLGLKQGWFPCVGPLTRPYSKKIGVPRLFAGLWLRIFDKDGVLLKEPDETAIFMLRQLFCLGKKIEVPCSPDRFNQTLKEYIEIEEQLREPTLQWEGTQWLNFDNCPTPRFRDGLASFEFPDDRPDITQDERRERLAGSIARLERYSARISTGLGYFNPIDFSTELWDRGDRPGTRHGPGAVADQRSKGYKYSKFPNWSAKLQNIFPFDFFGVSNAAEVLDEDFEYPASDNYPSTLYAVPKTAKGPRLIAAEPTANQWCQQLILAWLIERFRAIFGDEFITIKNQTPSREMAMLASKSGELATVDLSSASDRLSCWAIERFFCRNRPILDAFHAVRTESVLIPYKGFKQILPLRKFSTQGSALTFPVQSVFFLGCALASCGQDIPFEKALKRFRGQVRVFGDDIIVPNSWYADLVDLLTYLGLKVNTQKSFSTGLFRESCGMDAFAETNVTPTKPKSLRSDGPTRIMSLIDTSNNLWLTGLWHASKAVESLIPSYFRNKMPLGIRYLARDNISVGSPTLASFSGYSLKHLKTRWNQALQRDEVLSVRFKTTDRRKEVGGTGRLLQYFTERPDFSEPISWQGGSAARPKSTMRLGWEPLVHYAPVV